MAEQPKKKKIMIKKKVGGGKSPIRLNPAAESKKIDAAELPPSTLVLDSTPIAPPAAPAPEKKPEPAPPPPPAPPAPPPPPAPSPKTMVTEPPPEVKQPTTPQEILKFYCMYCGQKLSASKAACGRQIICPSCGNRIEVPPSN